jgi:hypothetical protein
VSDADDLWTARKGLSAEEALNLALERTLDLRQQIIALRMVNHSLVSFLRVTQTVDGDVLKDYFVGLLDAMPQETHRGEEWDRCRAEIESYLRPDPPALHLIQGGKTDD